MLNKIKNSKLDNNIDAVITWVNGNDINWQKKINNHSKVKIDFTSNKYLKRYNSIGEINIAIKSIINFASFVKNIYLVTDNQTPDSFEYLKDLALNKEINLQLIDHKVIFRGYEDNLPCFNSCSIGTMLFRIPNLAEHFIIFNDDTFLMRKTKVEDFFVNGEPILRGNWQKFDNERNLRLLFKKATSYISKTRNKNKISFKRLQQNSAKLTSAKIYLRRFHTPVNVRKSTLDFFFKKHETLLRENIKYRFRNHEQFIISSLSEHLEIQNKSYHFKKNLKLTYFRSYKKLCITKLKLKIFEKNKNKLFVTFQSLDMADSHTQNYILSWIDKKLIVK